MINFKTGASHLVPTRSNVGPRAWIVERAVGPSYNTWPPIMYESFLCGMQRLYSHKLTFAYISFGGVSSHDFIAQRWLNVEASFDFQVDLSKLQLGDQLEIWVFTSQ